MKNDIKHPIKDRVKKGALVWATFPARLIMPRGVGTRTHKIEKKEKEVVCPSCLTGILQNDDKGNWVCAYCHFDIKLASNKKEDIRAYIRTNGHGIQRHLDAEDIKKKINQRVLAARILAVLAWVLFIITALFLIKGKYLPFLAAFFVDASLILTVAINGYRAWQLATNNLYPIDGRKQFNYYLTHYVWVKNPLPQ